MDQERAKTVSLLIKDITNIENEQKQIKACIEEYVASNNSILLKIGSYGQGCYVNLSNLLTFLKAEFERCDMDISRIKKTIDSL